MEQVPLFWFVWNNRQRSSVPMPQPVLFETLERPVAEQPLCPNCGRGMRFYCVEPTDARGHEQRVFSCPECAQQKTILVKHE